MPRKSKWMDLVIMNIPSQEHHVDSCLFRSYFCPTVGTNFHMFLIFIINVFWMVLLFICIGEFRACKKNVMVFSLYFGSTQLIKLSLSSLFLLEFLGDVRYKILLTTKCFTSFFHICTLHITQHMYCVCTIS